ncbi:MAG: adenylate kinase [Euryarchaeota archaeon]|nr:adenylate kinase [Euryarchaeota archaeon]
MGAIIITGVPGVGKSTVINAAAESTKMPVVVYGTVMFEEASKRGLAKTRDEMRLLPPETQRQIQESAAVWIATQGDVIVDTHCTIKTPKGYLPGIPEWVATALKPDMVILVEATPKEILARRAKDASRHRDADDEASIALHQEINRAAASAIATLTGATLKIIHNKDGAVEATKRQILDAVGR